MGKKNKALARRQHASGRGGGAARGRRRKGKAPARRSSGSLALRLNMPESAQNVICELLCDLRLAKVSKQLTAADDDEDNRGMLEKEVRRLKRARQAPRKVLKALLEAELKARDEARQAAIAAAAVATEHAHSASSASLQPDVPSPRPAAARPRQAEGLGKRVRLQLVKEGGKAPKLLVLNRSGDLKALFEKAKGKLKIRKSPVAAYIQDTKEEIYDTLSVLDGTTIIVTDKARAQPPPAAGTDNGQNRGASAAASAGSRNDDDGSTATISGGGSSRSTTKAKRGALKVGSATQEILGSLLAAHPDYLPGRGGESHAAYVAPQRDAAMASELAQAQRDLEGSEAYRSALATRSLLPAFTAGEDIVRAVASRRVVVISGATGCGKTTQIPQLILEDAYRRGQGDTTRIVCTQPRRISAIGVAERVAAERGGLSPGAAASDVGYQIRLERRSHERTRLLFCTTGVLLRRMQRDGNLDGVSHIVVDEAHERDLSSDFLLVCLRDLMRRRSDLRIVIMSATLQADLFYSYFAELGAAPPIAIPGRLFPVNTQHLEEALSFVQQNLPDAKAAADAFRGLEKRPPLDTNAGAAQADGVLLSPACKEPINYGLVVELVRAIVRSEALNAGSGGAAGGSGGGMLVFLPGQAEIAKMCTALGAVDGLWVLPLHAGLPSGRQRRVFQRPPDGLRKIVCCTNVAETSITVDDIVHVIDACRVKEIRYEPGARVAALKEVWASKAAQRQRAGRAGRVMAGSAWRLVPRAFADALPDYSPPEMLRTPLEELVLQVLVLRLGQPMDFLAKALQAPAEEQVSSAIENLSDIGAIVCVSAAGEDEGGLEDEGDDYMDVEEGGEPEEKEEADGGAEDEEEEGPQMAAGANVEELLHALTPLGVHLAMLPLDCRVGKMLIYGAVFGCLDDMLSIAASLSCTKRLFADNRHARREAQQAKLRLAAGSESDLVAAANAYAGWEPLPPGERRAFAREHCLSTQALEEMRGLRGQFETRLREAGLLPAGHSEQRRRPSADLLKGLICAGLYPNIAVVLQAEGSRPRILAKDGQQWWCHPGSVNFQALGATAAKPRYVVYSQRLQTSKPYLLDTTVVSPLALLLFGGRVKLAYNRMGVIMDSWAPFKMTENAALCVNAIRREVDALLLGSVRGETRALSDEVRRTIALLIGALG